MSAQVTSWREIRAAENAELRARVHTAACDRARKMMPHLSAEAAAEMRTAMLAGPGSGLPDLILKHWDAGVHAK